MKYYLAVLTLLLFTPASGQKLFDSLKVEKILLNSRKQGKEIAGDSDIIRAIAAVDKNFRRITDTLFNYKSLKHTIFQTTLIQTNDSIFFNPLSFADKLHLENIVFDSKDLNAKINRIIWGLTGPERSKLFTYVKNRFANFSIAKRKFSPQPVRIRYMNLSDSKFVQVGIDIYGGYYLWTIDRLQNWDVVSTKELAVY